MKRNMKQIIRKRIFFIYDFVSFRWQSFFFPFSKQNNSFIVVPPRCDKKLFVSYFKRNTWYDDEAHQKWVSLECNCADNALSIFDAYLSSFAFRLAVHDGNWSWYFSSRGNKSESSTIRRMMMEILRRKHEEKNVRTRAGFVEIYETVRLLKLWNLFVRFECFKVNGGKRYGCWFYSKRFMMQKISVVSDWNKFFFNVVCEDFAWSAKKRSINFNSISSHPSASSSIDSDGIAMKAWKMFGLIKS